MYTSVEHKGVGC